MNLAFKTIIVAVGQFAASMERIVVVMVLSRTLTIFDYGTYQQVWLFYLLMLPLFTLGLPSSVLYFIPQAERQQRKTVVFQTLILLELIGVFFSLITLFTAPFVAEQFNNPDLVQYLRIFSIYPLFALPPKLITLLMVAEDKPVLSAVIAGVTMVITVLFLTIPSLIGLPLSYTFYSANAGAFLLFLGVMAYILWTYRSQRFVWDLGLMRSQIVYAIPLGLAGVLGVLSKQLNKTVVSSTFSPEIYAIYVNGAFEIPFIGLLTGSLMTVLVPEFVKRLKAGESQGAVWNLWNTATTKTALLLFPISAALFLFAPEFMVVMFSAKYLASTPVFQVYLLLAVLRITQYGALLQALGRTQLILYTSVFGLLVNLVLSIVLLRFFGMLGPAWANVITTYLWGLSYLIIICRLLNISFRQIMPWKELGKIMIVSIGAGILAWPLTLLPVNEALLLFFGVILYIIVYGFILATAGLVSIEMMYSRLKQTLLYFRPFQLR